MSVTSRSKMHPYAIRAPHAHYSIDDLQHESHPIFHAAAILIFAMVCRVLEELVDQVAIRTVNLNPIESGLLRVFRATFVLLNDVLNLINAKLAGGNEGFLRTNQTHMSSRCDSTR